MTAHTAAPAARTVIRASRLLHVEDLAVIPNAAVVIEGDTIAYAGPADQVTTTPADTVLDCGDRTLLPGLIDAHVHFFGIDTLHTQRLFTDPEPYRALRAARDASALLDAGFTWVRCLGSSVGTHLARAVAEGLVRGPSIVPAGQFICSTTGTWDEKDLPAEVVARLDLYADGEDACRAAVRRRVRAGAGVIKVGVSSGSIEDHFRSWGDRPNRQRRTYSVPEIRALVDEAHRYDVKVSAHAIGDDAVQSAIAAGVDIVEHAHGISSRTRDLLAESGTTVVPTLTHMFLMAEHGREHGISEEVVQVAAVHLEEQREAFAGLLSAGVTLASGSDLIGPPWASLDQGATEPRLMVEAGMSTGAALQAVTLTNAAVLGVEQQAGSLRPGKRGDVVAVSGDPLRDIGSLGAVDLVVKAGVVERNALDPAA